MTIAPKPPDILPIGSIVRVFGQRFRVIAHVHHRSRVEALHEVHSAGVDKWYYALEYAHKPGEGQRRSPTARYLGRPVAEALWCSAIRPSQVERRGALADDNQPDD